MQHPTVCVVRQSDMAVPYVIGDYIEMMKRTTAGQNRVQATDHHHHRSHGHCIATIALQAIASQATAGVDAGCPFSSSWLCDISPYRLVVGCQSRLRSPLSYRPDPAAALLGALLGALLAWCPCLPYLLLACLLAWLPAACHGWSSLNSMCSSTLVLHNT